MPQRSDADQPARSLECPRCGYDLSGLVHSWEGACPLVGVCSECGYELEWANVFDPTRERLPWLYEHARSWWAPGPMLKTAFLALLPWIFWKRVQPKHRIRLSRAFALPIILILAVHVMGVLAGQGMALARDAMPIPTPSTSATTFNSHSARAYFMLLYNRTRLISALGGELAPNLLIHMVVWASVSASAGYLFAALVARKARRRDRVRAVHLWRIFAYSLAIVSLMHAWHWGVILWLDGALTLAQWEIWAKGLAALASNPIQPPGYWLTGQVVYEGWPVILTSLAWPALVWGSAFGRGLRVRSGWQVWVAGVILSLLCLAVAMVTVLPVSRLVWYF